MHWPGIQWRHPICGSHIVQVQDKLDDQMQSSLAESSVKRPRDVSITRPTYVCCEEWISIDSRRVYAECGLASDGSVGRNYRNAHCQAMQYAQTGPTLTSRRHSSVVNLCAQCLC